MGTRICQAAKPWAMLVGTFLVALTLGGCQDRAAQDTNALASPAATASQVAPPSFVGTEPVAAPEGLKASASAKASAGESEVSKSQQSNDMPMPGQANGHSTLDPSASQKANTK